ncbi:adenosylcobinamide-phosphate synthase CbiB [Acidovorax sp. NCPPB 3576]|uniref:adenosylcobinamide-phosphate synthase CbiB n=1 Tax=Acidovorax sp. NCPPB 3576 TaxID=2940488 RepID=UPI00234A3816|nr:adenosylcobinamide-phosphate synthase CbiB [Acidovorax sp. NCPPB 3576]WCM86736.1 adenosylcobinamide-phosphate synthase CbiB [Acidovorax sp. NCPPB 3576]
MDAAWALALAPAAALPLALAIDRCFGEPPVAVHPVVWMGHALQAGGDRVAPRAPTPRDWKSFWLAALLWCAVAAMVLIVSAVLQWAVLRHAPPWLAAVLMALLLKPLLAWRMLRDEVLAVEAALAESLEAGRARLARLVSRDVQALDAVQVRESAIESLAENLNDSVVAPLFWFALLGLPGAALYRFANTADAMWGYPGMRGGRYWQWAGKWAARADDALSWLPARLTALLLWAIAGGPRWRVLAAQARRTPSPNSGWPMAAMALALGVRLAKPGVYTLNGEGRGAAASDTPQAARWASKVVIAGGLIAMIAHFSIAFWALRWT